MPHLRGTAVHADDLRMTAASKKVVVHQVRDFANKNHLKLNMSKLEIGKLTQQQKVPEPMDFADVEIETAPKLSQSSWAFGGSTISLTSEPFTKISARLGKPFSH